MSYGSFLDNVRGAQTLSEAISIVHPDWPATRRAYQIKKLQEQDVGVQEYISNPATYSWEAYDAPINEQYDAEQAKIQSDAAQKASYPTVPTLENGWWVTRDANGNVLDYTQADTGGSSGGPAVRSETRGGLVYFYDAAGNIVSTSSDPSYVSDWDRTQAAQQAASAQAAAAYQQQRLALERAASTWSQYTDAGGVWKKNQLGEVVRVGEVPQGEVQNMPSTWSGWGTSWQQSPQYNAGTQRMDTVYNKTPLTYEENLAQGQYANLPGNWINVGLMNRTLPNQEQKYNTYVGETVGRLVGSQPGYTQNYDLQQGQAATGITPAGWYDTSQDSNAWQQGYGPQYGGTGTGEGGGYLTQVPSYQDYTGWNQTSRDQMSGWLNSGMSDYTQEDDYWAAMNRMRAPQRYSGVSYR